MNDASHEGRAALPRGWQQMSLAELLGDDSVFADGDWIESKDQDPDGDVRLVQLADIGDGVYRNRSARFLTGATATRLRCTFLKADDVLVARMPDPLGRACLFPGDSRPAVTAVDVCIIRPSTPGPSPRWLCWFLNSPEVRGQIASLQAGTTRKRISRKNLATITFNVPPRPEQDAIVAEIEKQFTRLDAGVAALQRLQAHLRRYRAAVLKAACQGKLVPTEAELARRAGRRYESGSELLSGVTTDEGFVSRKQRGGDGASMSRPPFDLPEGWAATPLWTIADLKGGITKGQRRKATDRLSQVPYLRVANVQRGFLDLDEVKTIEATEEEIAELSLRRGDILFNEGGDRDKLGRGWIWSDEIDGCIHQNHVFRARLRSPRMNPKFISWYGNTFGQEYFTREGKQTTNLASINLTKLSAFPVPIPPAAEQDRIVAAVEERLDCIGAVEATAETSLKRANRLRAAVLAAAFSGQLLFDSDLAGASVG